MTDTNRIKFERLKETFINNFKVTRMYAEYLERYPEIITADMINALTEDGSISKEEAIVALLSEIFALDFDNKDDRVIIRDYLTPSIRILDAKKYENDPYYKKIKLDEIKDGSWEIKKESYLPYRGVICHDMILSDGYREVPPLGFFTEEFSFPAILENGNEWMTLTPVDLDTCEDAIKEAHGKVVTFGLGLGYYAYMAAMKEEVVVIGYGVAKKNDLTGSVTAMKPDEMNKGLVTNAQDMMQGKIAGVNVTSASGTPGAGAQIRIRGGSSLNASNDPLIVIDGLAMDNSGVQGLSNPLSMVNPNDIETFTVLKDASATAIYGSRGSNGVIIITTKKGKSGAKPTVNYSGNVSVSTKKKTIEVMDGNEFRQFVTEMYGEGSDAVNTLGTANTDWQSEIYRAAISTDHNITLSGGLKNMPYRATIGYTNQQGILKTSNFERFTASLNLSPSLLEDHLKLNLNAKGMIANTRYANTSAVNAAVWMDPTQSIYDSRDEYKNFGGYFQWTSNGAALNDPNWPLTYNTLATKNPVALLDQQDDNATSKTFIGNAEFDYKVHGFEDLRLHMNLGADYSTGKQTTIISPYSSTNHYYGWDGWTETDKYNLLFTAYAQYMKDFNEANHFDIMGGYEWQHFHREGMSNGWGYYQDTNTEKPGQTPFFANRILDAGFEILTEGYFICTPRLLIGLDERSENTPLGGIVAAAI